MKASELTLVAKVRGDVLETNFDDVRAKVTEYINSINYHPVSAEEYADAKGTVKFLSSVEKALGDAERQILAGSGSIYKLMDGIADLKEQTRKARLDLNRAVTKKEKQIKEKVVSDYTGLVIQARDFLINTGIPSDVLPRKAEIESSLRDAAKGKRKLETFEAAVETRSKQMQIEMNHVAAGYKGVLARIDECEYPHLFPDREELAKTHYPDEDLEILIRERVEAYEAIKRKEEEELRKKAEAKARAEEEERRRQEEEARRLSEQAQAEAETRPPAVQDDDDLWPETEPVETKKPPVEAVQEDAAQEPVPQNFTIVLDLFCTQPQAVEIARRLKNEVVFLQNIRLFLSDEQ